MSESEVTNPMKDIVNGTCLPPSIWPSIRPEPKPKLKGSGYRLDGPYNPHYSLYWGDRWIWDWIRVHDNIVDALQRLPLAQLFGHATLVRTPTQLTALISIAEAAAISMDDSYCQLLWVMANVIQNSMKADGRGYQEVSWKEEDPRRNSGHESGVAAITSRPNVDHGSSLYGGSLSNSASRRNRRNADDDESSAITARSRRDNDYYESYPSTIAGSRRDVGYSDSYPATPTITGGLRDVDDESGSATIASQIVRLREQQQSFQNQLEAMKRQNDQMIGILQQSSTTHEQQERFQDQLEVIQRQNDQIIRILLEKPQSTDQQSNSTRNTSSLVKRADESDAKSFLSRSTRLGAIVSEGQWFLCVDRSERDGEGQALAFLLDWLEARLGGFSFKPSWTSPSVIPGSLDLEVENNMHAEGHAQEAQVEEPTGGCWRKKILSGSVLILYPGAAKASSSGTGSEEGTPSQLPGMVPDDCLLLTAAALWSLFDNSLERVPNCRCTFKAAGGDYIQCQRSEEGWLLWHTFSSDRPCNGQDCNLNVPIALVAREAGFRLETTTPCALGWLATSRNSPNSTIWTTIRVTTQFRKKKYVRYTVKEIQALAQLSVPLLVAPQLGGTVSFAKRYIEVANSIEHESIHAMESAAAAVVLVYDERRGVHLSLDGADVIEMCCIHILRQMGCDTTRLPPFPHSSALFRLQTWCSSTFISARQTHFTGDHVVRQATRKVSELIEATKKASLGPDRTLLYWILEDVLRSSSCQAIEAPKSLHTSWHDLAFAAPPLILVVGDLDPRYLTLQAPPRWLTSKTQSRPSITRLFGLPEFFRRHIVPGGIMSSRDTMKRWIRQAEPFFQAKLTATNDEIAYGETPTDVEHTYEVEENMNRGDQAALDGFGFGNCACKEEEAKRCLHYVQ